MALAELALVIPGLRWPAWALGRSLVPTIALGIPTWSGFEFYRPGSFDILPGIFLIIILNCPGWNRIAVAALALP